MADLTNLKLGETAIDGLMHATADKVETPPIIDYLKYANDAGGYYVHGLWLAPTNGSTTTYWWPWDLSVPSGALKDDNAGFRYWGYVRDGYNKNITSGMNTSFPANGWANFGVAITIKSSLTNYTDDNGRSLLDFGDHPVIITFLDDRFDDFTWVAYSGSVYEWSDDKRTITIYRTNGAGVCYSDNADKSIATVRAQLTNVYASMQNLERHALTVTDPSAVECWDAYAGSEQVWHKDRTIDNCWIKYGIAQYLDDFEDVENGIPAAERNKTLVVDGHAVSGTYNGIGVPLTTDYKQRILESTPSNYIRFNVKDYGGKLWPDLKEFCKNNNVRAPHGFFLGSNIDGELVFRTNSQTLHEFIRDTKITKVTLYAPNITSCHRMFRKAAYLKEIVFDGTMAGARDTSGMFEECYQLQAYPAKMLNWAVRNLRGLNDISNMCPYCHNLTEIPSFNSDDREADNNTIVVDSFVQQAFYDCFSLTRIGPVLDMSHVKPLVNGVNMAWRMLGGCGKLTDMRMKNLGNGIWYFDEDGTNGHGRMDNLDAESLIYMFSWLASDELRNEQRSEIHCPQAWEDTMQAFDWSRTGVTYDEFIGQEVMMRGFDIYFGGVKKELYYRAPAATVEFHIDGILVAQHPLDGGTYTIDRVVSGINLSFKYFDENGNETTNWGVQYKWVDGDNNLDRSSQWADTYKIGKQNVTQWEEYYIELPCKMIFCTAYGDARHITTFNFL